MWIEVFRAGRHTDSEGRRISFSAKDIGELAERYNRSVGTDPANMAPLVKGHPEMDEPAYGWIDSLKAEGDKLFADATGVERQLYHEIGEGRYRNVSISLDQNGGLRHVGVLGAVRPAVKGMEPLRFVEYSPGTIVADGAEKMEAAKGSETNNKEDRKVEMGNRRASKFGNTGERNGEIDILKKQNKELSAQVSHLNRQIQRDKRVRKFSERVEDINPKLRISELDRLFLKLADIDDEEMAEDILDALATVATEMEAKKASEGARKQGDTEAKRKSDYGEFLGKEFDLGMPRETAASDRDSIHDLIAERQLQSPDISYEECLDSMIAAGR